MEKQVSEPSKGFSERLRDLFSNSKKSDVDVLLEQQTQSNPENRRQGETYQQWGTRICAVVAGSVNALPPYLQKVYNSIYNEQSKNVELQKQARANTQSEINQKNEEIRTINDKIGNANSEIEESNKKIEELKAERQEIKRGKEQVNKEQRLKLIIGLIIIIPLTVYLFLFYSSTFYSAFFRDPENMTTVMNSMFDPNALANAYNGGITELGFVLSAPIIFLGLGFTLHFFSVQKGKSRFLKMGAILLVTVMFDCILAYKIGDQLHKFGIMTGQYPIGEAYTVSMAFHDINTWAVIFCGFIVYVIWGIVFDMCMSAYDKMDLNKTRLENIKNEITEIEKSIQNNKNNIQTLKQQETNTKNDVQKLMAKLGHEVYIDFSAIRTEMTNFFAGWITMMQVLTLEQEKQDQASAVFKNEIALLIPVKKTN